MSSRLDAVVVHAEDPPRVGRFWAELLGRGLDTRTYVDVVPDDRNGFRLRFLPTQEPRSGLNKMHLHLTSRSDADQREIIDKALALGGQHLDVGQLPDEGHMVLADPGGNEFCVIAPGSTFLAGCGFLGEVACDGSRDVGVFWSAALDWPLVWDEDRETAIQSPHGGTKVAWGGPPVIPARSRGGLHFDLGPPAGCDAQTEVDRLVSLGARVVWVAEGEHTWTVLTDPDGNEFRLFNR